jgi:NADH/F420H2 dehydrogenase subunit C
VEKGRFRVGIMKELIKFNRYMVDLFPSYFDKVEIKNVETTKELRYLLGEKAELVVVMLFLRDHSYSLFKMLVDVSGIDFPQRKKRFVIKYCLQSLFFNKRIIIEKSIGELEFIPSINGIFDGANWPEREIWDLYGIFFSNHKDLRRILTDYGFKGHPLRKDFPLTGFVELIYDDEQKSVIGLDLEISQEFRIQEGLSPWDQIDEINK